MARPKNSERYSPQAQRKLVRELCGDALEQMKKQIKAGNVDFQSLSSFVSKVLPVVVDDNTETATDVTMDLLIKKAIKVDLRIREANEEGLKEEEDEPKQEEHPANA